jgi:hypothetical protein
MFCQFGGFADAFLILSSLLFVPGAVMPCFCSSDPFVIALEPGIAHSKAFAVFAFLPFLHCEVSFEPSFFGMGQACHPLPDALWTTIPCSIHLPVVLLSAASTLAGLQAVCYSPTVVFIGNMPKIPGEITSDFQHIKEGRTSAKYELVLLEF